ncbi:methionine ABC transporter ATP-binding protein [Vagococcus zengguangii]|uniref:methionine ABC transporter ATP-binding protein n=1 Tax=Vagococcus zengguangii TaxID=2571750 RepID=UPI0012AEE07A|nr:ATP-binding cassette domain-containing protein [Vagococcus zengguangii]
MPIIELKNITKQYESKKRNVLAVNQVDFKVYKGEIFGMVGYSGAGKSTLLRLLNGLEKPTSGEILVNRQPVAELKGKMLRNFRQEVGMIFQHFNLLWSRTVLENIMLPMELVKIPKAEREARALELVELVGLTGREHAYPSELSGGQKQRVGIARALANNPKILLCDEATSALDPQTTDEVLDLLKKVNKELGITIVLITHEMHVIRKICDKVAVMENGKIVETGSVIEVFSHPKMDVTKRFVQQETVPEVTDDNSLVYFERNYPDGKVAKLTFTGDKSKLPILSKTIREFMVDINVIQGQIQEINQSSFGTLIVQFVGEEKEIERAIVNLISEGVSVEVNEDAE